VPELQQPKGCAAVTRQRIADSRGEHRYFTMLPNMVDRSDLDVYEFRLYAHYKRVCGESASGECWESVRTTAEACRITHPTVIRARNGLTEKGWIAMATEGKRGAVTVTITIVDRWDENAQASGGPVNQATSKPVNEATGVVATLNGTGSDVSTKKNPGRRTLEEDAGARAPTPAKPKRSKRLLTDDDVRELVLQYAPSFGGSSAVERKIQRFRNFRGFVHAVSQRQYIVDRFEEDLESARGDQPVQIARVDRRSPAASDWDDVDAAVAKAGGW
jgi:hypothetical protein